MTLILIIALALGGIAFLAVCLAVVAGRADRIHEEPRGPHRGDWTW